MIALQIAWAIICVSLMGWSFWRFGKAVTEVDRAIQRDRELADYHGKIAENRKGEIANLRGELKSLIEVREQIRKECEQAEKEISFKSQFDRKHLFLLSDRRGPEDLEWHVPVGLRDGFGMIWHPAVAQSWSKGREMILWAKSRDAAKRTVTARLSESSGFIVGEPVEGSAFPVKKAPKAEPPPENPD